MVTAVTFPTMIETETAGIAGILYWHLCIFEDISDLPQFELDI